MIRSVTQSEGSITIFHLKEDLTTDKVKAFTKKMHELIDSGRIFISLDLSSVQNICLFGLVSISSIFNKCRQAGGSLKVVGLTSTVRRSFRDTNLINTIEVYENSLEAIKSFRSRNLLKTRGLSGSFFLEDQNSFVGWDRLPMRSYFN